ncbi:Tudor/PWWP/MBT superfamily protein [Striga asiatica]|uniref:Tudor/PWWP/MBT superfamily protein n=1 Tax=Striga asiatica TaxID=4170 RepID=A0A5A7QM93_STRAF|nr:Tudor/PWWP/MBT superfamily protein [Striga asiatica]
MGSSGEDPTKGINGSVGGLIWVRQRNGSWWPGKILGPDELPEGSVPSPRSGTPVKLLGKEGSNVGWYNLEKSKRVKAFHNEDHDKCIEKLKASKNAIKDEAIIHVLELELESARPGKNHADHESPSASYLSEESEVPDENSSSSTHGSGEGSKKFDKLRGLDDPKEDVSRHTSGLWDLRMNLPFLSLKRKRSKVGNNQEFSKKKNKRRTFTEVLDSTALVSAHVAEKMSSPSGVSLLETKESKEKDLDTLKNKRKENGISSKLRGNESFGSLFDVSLVAEEKGSAGLPSTTPDSSHEAQRADKNSHIKISSSQMKRNNESAPKGKYPEWQAKGKRNSRSKRHYPKYEPSSLSPKTGLQNVPLEVRSGPERPHSVPYVSLASKLTGRQIVGHPITVELLGRRRSGPHNNARLSICSKNEKKTRKLSALTKKGPVGKVKGPSVACVPLSVVFSRINADLSGSRCPV